MLFSCSYVYKEWYANIWNTIEQPICKVTIQTIKSVSRFQLTKSRKSSEFQGKHLFRRKVHAYQYVKRVSEKSSYALILNDKTESGTIVVML